jgi:hypothetical protein
MVSYRITVRLTITALQALTNRRWRFQRANRGKSIADGLGDEVRGLLGSLNVLPEDARVRCREVRRPARRQRRR